MIIPLVGSSLQIKILNWVDLPAPFEPTKPTFSPFLTSQLIFFKTTSVEKILLTSSNLITVLKIEFTKSVAYLLKIFCGIKLIHEKNRTNSSDFHSCSSCNSKLLVFWTLAGGGGYNKRIKPIPAPNNNYSKPIPKDLLEP